MKDLFKLKGKVEEKLARINLVFIFIFLNLWDFIVSRTFFNGMIVGLMMFGPSAVLWHIGKFKAVVLINLLSIFEFMVMLIFVLEGFGLGGAAVTLKSLFWVPFLMMAGTNTFVGLKIYSKFRQARGELKLL